MSPVVFIGMESSGQLRRRFQERGFFTVSADNLPADDGAEMDLAGLGGHYQGDVFECLDFLWSIGRWPDLAIFHPTCTYLTCSAEWAYKDPDFTRYPGVGYHQKLKPGTLFGADRRAARERSMDEFRKIRALPIRLKGVENPKGALSRICKPSQIIQPNHFGDDASKETHLWYFDKDGNPAPEMILPIDPAKRVPGRMVNGRERWSNQTDSGQNKLPPGADRWKDRSRTYPGVADAWAEHWSKFL